MYRGHEEWHNRYIMAEDPIKTEIASDVSSIKRDDLGRILPGQQSLNPNGKPKGQRSYATIFKEVLEQIAKENGISAEEVENRLIKVGYKKAVEGNFLFYQDAQNRIHGKAVQPLDHTSKGERIGVPLLSPEQQATLDKLINTNASQPTSP